MRLAHESNHLAGKKTSQLIKLFLLAGYEKAGLSILWFVQSMSIGQLTKKFLFQLGVSPRFNSSLHPLASGVVERFKQMLHFAMRDYGRQWHLVISYLICSLREVPNSTTGYSPHLLFFGRMPRGPLCILKES